MRKLSWQKFKHSLSETIATNAMAFILLIGGVIVSYFLAVTRLPFELANVVGGLQVNRYFIFAGIVVLFLFLGCVMPVLPMIIIMVPIIYPVVAALGFDLIWFGIIVVRMVEIGQITPPVGINVFVIKAIAKDVPMYTVFRGILPFFIADLIHVVILVIFPMISLFLPGLMK